MSVAYFMTYLSELSFFLMIIMRFLKDLIVIFKTNLCKNRNKVAADDLKDVVEGEVIRRLRNEMVIGKDLVGDFELKRRVYEDILNKDLEDCRIGENIGENDKFRVLSHFSGKLDNKFDKKNIDDISKISVVQLPNDHQRKSIFKQRKSSYGRKVSKEKHVDGIRSKLAKIEEDEDEFNQQNSMNYSFDKSKSQCPKKFPNQKKENCDFEDDVSQFSDFPGKKVQDLDYEEEDIENTFDNKKLPPDSEDIHNEAEFSFRKNNNDKDLNWLEHTPKVDQSRKPRWLTTPKANWLPSPKNFNWLKSPSVWSQKSGQPSPIQNTNRSPKVPSPLNKWMDRLTSRNSHITKEIDTNEKTDEIKVKKSQRQIKIREAGKNQKRIALGQLGSDKKIDKNSEKKIIEKKVELPAKSKKSIGSWFGKSEKQISNKASESKSRIEDHGVSHGSKFEISNREINFALESNKSMTVNKKPDPKTTKSSRQVQSTGMSDKQISNMLSTKTVKQPKEKRLKSDKKINMDTQDCLDIEDIMADSTPTGRDTPKFKQEFEKPMKDVSINNFDEINQKYKQNIQKEVEIAKSSQAYDKECENTPTASIESINSTLRKNFQKKGDKPAFVPMRQLEGILFQNIDHDKEVCDIGSNYSIKRCDVGSTYSIKRCEIGSNVSIGVRNTQQNIADIDLGSSRSISQTGIKRQSTFMAASSNILKKL